MPSVSAAEIYAAMPDEHFPFMPGWNVESGPLIALPHRGNQIHARCLACEREAEISGRRLVVEFTEHLPFSVGRFVSALRCSGCGSRRLLGCVRADPGAWGFQVSTQEDGRIIWCRRLNTWLAEVGQEMFAYLDVLSDCPNEATLALAGIRRHGA